MPSQRQAIAELVARNIAGKVSTREFFEALAFAFDRRITALEDLRVEVEAAKAELLSIGLSNINEVLQPIADDLNALLALAHIQYDALIGGSVSSLHLIGSPTAPTQIDADTSTLIATTAHVSGKIASLRGAINGLASLDGSGLIPTSQLPALAITNTSVVASQAAMLALTAQQGDIAIRSDLNKSFVLSTNSPSTLADWKELLTPTDVVLSVAGLVGAVSAAGLKTALSLDNVSNTSDANKPVSTAQQTALDLKADLSKFPGTTVAGTIPQYVSAGGNIGNLGTTNFSIVSDKLVGVKGMRTFDVTIADDAVATLDLTGAVLTGIIVAFASTSAIGVTVPTGLFCVRINTAALGLYLAINDATNIAFATTVLTGLSGVDGQLTIGNPGTSILYIENRLGSSRTYRFQAIVG